MPVEYKYNPLITIGITAYNAEDTILLAVESAVAQTWVNTEIICVDDASSDNTLKVLQNITAQNNIRIIQLERNSGVAVARNRIIEEANGEFIAYFDDDDKSHPDRLVRQYKRIIDYEQNYSNGYPVICHTARNQIMPGGGVYYVPTAGTRMDSIAPNGKPVARGILTGEFTVDGFGALATCSQMGRKSTYISAGLFDNELRRCEDTVRYQISF